VHFIAHVYVTLVVYDMYSCIIGKNDRIDVHTIETIGRTFSKHPTIFGVFRTGCSMKVVRRSMLAVFATAFVRTLIDSILHCVVFSDTIKVSDE
jgi:hypothetical protein